MTSFQFASQISSVRASVQWWSSACPASATIGSRCESRSATEATFRFASLDHLHAFEASDLRARYLDDVVDLVEADAIWKTHTGLEMWFDPPAGTTVPQPIRWRMAVVLGVVVYVLVLAFGAVASALLGNLAFPLRLAIVIAVEITLMTYVILPRVARYLASWIYPTSTRAA